mgnify:CR=1 FL=1
MALTVGLSGAVWAQDDGLTVGVSWSNFQEERWKTDEAAIKAQLEKLGAKYISADAGGSPEKQLGDIERKQRPARHVVRGRHAVEKEDIGSGTGRVGTVSPCGTTRALNVRTR